MTTGITQRHVAIVFTRSTRPNSSEVLNGLGCKDILWRTTQRWQSTATKAIPISSEVQPPFRGNEIPSDCFVDSPTFPEPSLSRTQNSAEVDLSTTRPAPLNSPASLEPRDYPDGNIPLGDRTKYLYKLGRSYLSFYKTGLKNVWLNSKRYRAIRQKFQGYPVNTAAKYGGQIINKKAVPAISHSEYQIFQRTRHDLLKMLPFSLVFLICGEFTPLVIIALGSSVVPYTCRIPRQEAKDLEKKLQHDKNYMEDLSRIEADLRTTVEVPNWRIEHLEAYRLGLTVFRNPIPVLGPIYHAVLTRPRLIRHCDNLVSDTLLIHRQGGAFKLSHQDIYEWADTYGLYALRQYVQKCKEAGQNHNNEQLKTQLLPKVDAEMKYMLEEVADWSRLKPNEQWRIGLRTVGSRSPDWEARVKDVRKIWKSA